MFDTLVLVFGGGFGFGMFGLMVWAVVTEPRRQREEEARVLALETVKKAATQQQAAFRMDDWRAARHRAKGRVGTGKVLAMDCLMGLMGMRMREDEYDTLKK